jgi:hypothetical protein
MSAIQSLSSSRSTLARLNNQKLAKPLRLMVLGQSAVGKTGEFARLLRINRKTQNPARPS